MRGVHDVTTGRGTKEAPIAVPKAVQPYLLSLIEHLSDAVSIFDREWRCLYLNATAFEMAQFAEKKPEEVLGNSIWELRPDLVETPCYQHFHRVVEQQVSVQFEMYQPLSGRWFEHCCYPTFDGMAMLTRDITEQKTSCGLLWMTAHGRKRRYANGSRNWKQSWMLSLHQSCWLMTRDVPSLRATQWPISSTKLLLGKTCPPMYQRRDGFSVMAGNSGRKNSRCNEL